MQYLIQLKNVHVHAVNTQYLMIVWCFTMAAKYPHSNLPGTTAVCRMSAIGTRKCGNFSEILIINRALNWRHFYLLFLSLIAIADYPSNG